MSRFWKEYWFIYVPMLLIIGGIFIVLGYIFCPEQMGKGH